MEIEEFELIRPRKRKKHPARRCLPIYYHLNCSDSWESEWNLFKKYNASTVENWINTHRHNFTYKQKKMSDSFNNATFTMMKEHKSSCHFSTSSSISPALYEDSSLSGINNESSIDNNKSDALNHHITKRESPFQDLCDEIFPRGYSPERELPSLNLKDSFSSLDLKNDNLKCIAYQSPTWESPSDKKCCGYQLDTKERISPESCKLNSKETRIFSPKKLTFTDDSNSLKVKEIPLISLKKELPVNTTCMYQNKSDNETSCYNSSSIVSIKTEVTSDDEDIFPKSCTPSDDTPSDDICTPIIKLDPDSTVFTPQKIIKDNSNQIQKIDNPTNEYSPGESGVLSIRVDSVYSLKEPVHSDKPPMLKHAIQTSAEYYQRRINHANTIHYGNNAKRANFRAPHYLDARRNIVNMYPHGVYGNGQIPNGLQPGRGYYPPSYSQPLTYHEIAHLRENIQDRSTYRPPTSTIRINRVTGPNRVPVAYGSTINHLPVKNTTFVMSNCHHVPDSSYIPLVGNIKSSTSYIKNFDHISKTPNSINDQMMREYYSKSATNLDYNHRMNDIRNMSHRYSTQTMSTHNRLPFMNDKHLQNVINNLPNSTMQTSTSPIESAVLEAMMKSNKNKQNGSKIDHNQYSPTSIKKEPDTHDDQLCQNFSSLTHKDTSRNKSTFQPSTDLVITSVIGSTDIPNCDTIVSNHTQISSTSHTESYVKEVLPSSHPQVTQNPLVQHQQQSHIDQLWQQLQQKEHQRVKTEHKQSAEYTTEYSTVPLDDSLKPYVCNICLKRFSKRSILNTHKANHTGKRPFACNLCDKTFKVKGNLKIHQLIHAGIKPYVCDICNKRFTQSCNLTTHRVTHTGRKAFSCHLCFKRFTVKGSLKIHLLTHSGERRFMCDICDKTFTQNSSLTTHKLIHSGTKPYRCELCNKSFGLKGNLKTHMLIHTGTKPFTCELCGKSFGTRHNLKTHQLTHTGEKPFACDICHKRFTHRISLKAHRLGKHCIDK